MQSNFLHPQDPSGPELPRLKCAFHSDSYLTNFCSSKECLLPLCPSCIKIHINEHINMQSNPQLQNINDSIRELHQQLESYSQKINGLYKNLVQVESGVDEFRDKLKGKICNVKHDLIATIQDQFKRIQLTAMHKVNQLKYVKNLVKFKDYAKKAILSLKNSQRNFFAEQSKIIRMMIKFQANGLKNQLEHFCHQSQQFLQLKSQDFIKVSMKDSDAQKSIQNMSNLLKIQLEEPFMSAQPRDITPLIKQLYQKPAERKEVRKSLNRFMNIKATPAKKPIQPEFNSKHFQSIQPIPINQFAQLITTNKEMSMSQAQETLQEIDQNENYDFVMPSGQDKNKQTINYNSVKESIVKATKDFNRTICRNTKIESSAEPFRSKRRSVSRGRGITLINSTIDHSRGRPSSFLKGDINLDLINSKTEYVPRKFR